MIRSEADDGEDDEVSRGRDRRGRGHSDARKTSKERGLTGQGGFSGVRGLQVSTGLSRVRGSLHSDRKAGGRDWRRKTETVGDDVHKMRGIIVFFKKIKRRPKILIFARKEQEPIAMARN